MLADEKRNLELYNEKVERILEHSLIKQKGKFSMFPEFKINNKKPTEEQIESFLARFRAFYMKGEPTYFLRICDILYTSIEDDKKKEEIVYLRATYNKILNKGSGFGFYINKNKISPDHNINLWLNAYYFHSDDEKRKQLKDLQNLPGDIAKAFLILEIMSLVRVIVFLNNIVKEILS